MIKHFTDIYYYKDYIETYLENKAKEGYLLKKIYLNMFYSFEKSRPKDSKYEFVLYSPSDYNVKYEERAKNDLIEFKKNGWVLRNKDTNYLLMESDENKARPEIFDELTERSFIKKKASSFMWKLPIYLTIFIYSITNFISSYRTNANLAPLHPEIFEKYQPDILLNLRNEMIISAILIAIPAMFFFSYLVFQMNFYFRNRKAFTDSSVPIKYAKPSPFHNSDLALLLVLISMIIYFIII